MFGLPAAPFGTIAVFRLVHAGYHDIIERNASLRDVFARFAVHVLVQMLPDMFRCGLDSTHTPFQEFSWVITDAGIAIAPSSLQPS